MMFVVLNDLNLTIALPQAVTNEQYQCHLTQLVKRSHSTKLKAGAHNCYTYIISGTVASITEKYDMSLSADFSRTPVCFEFPGLTEAA